jgi:hypothetical protein
MGYLYLQELLHAADAGGTGMEPMGEGLNSSILYLSVQAT